MVKVGPRDADTPSSADQPPAAPSPYWADETIWNSQTTVHSFAMDKQGRVWAAARVRKPQTPAWCQAGSDHPSAKLMPINQGQRGLIMYDPKTKKVTQIDTCFTWGHLNFDDNDVIWSSFGPGGHRGLVRREEVGSRRTTRKPRRAGARSSSTTTATASATPYTEPNQPPIRRRIAAGLHLLRRFTGAGWIGVGHGAGRAGRPRPLHPGAHPPETALTEFFEVPWNNPKATTQGFAPRGMDVDSKGVVWTVLSSGQLASFDRKKCTGAQNGPTATGQQCVDGWTLYPLPGPNYKGAVDNASADSAYYNFVDRFDMLGVGKDIPVAGGNLSEGLLALVNGKIVTFRVPYPMGYYTKGLDGASTIRTVAGRGRRSTRRSRRARRSTWKAEGDHAELVKFQVRPDPTSK
jgi:hypothetical protein